MKTKHALALALLLPLNVAVADVEFALVPDEASLRPGNTLVMDLIGTYLGEGDIVGGAANLSFDSSILEVLNITLQAPTDIAASISVIDNGAGTVTGIGFASFAGVNGSFELASVEFRALNIGQSAVSIFNANDPIYVWANSFGQEVAFTGSTATVSVVPETSSLAMMLAGLGLVGAIARRRRKK